MTDVLVIIPAYNESANIETVVGRLNSICPDYDYVVVNDGSTDSTAEICRRCGRSMKEKMDEGYDIVIGSRFVGEKKPFTMRMIGSRMIGFAIRLTTGKKIQDPTSGMRMFSRRMIEMFAEGLNFGPEPDTVSYLIRKGAKVAEVPVKMDERMGGVSYLTPLKSASYMIKMLVSILVIQGFR